MGSIQGKPMKPIAWCALILLCSFPFAFAQRASFSSDAMGAHLNYGRGCAACHTPHSSALANGAGESSQGSIAGALWGEDVTGLWSKTIAAGSEIPVEDSPRSISEERPDIHGMLNCLTCHDGNYAPSSMMQNRVYEKLPEAYGLDNSIPTFMGVEGFLHGDTLNEHPMGLSATLNCGGEDGWDCSQREGVITMTGAKSSRFVKDYGFFVKPGNYNGIPVVVCATCHDPHSMNMFSIGVGSKSGMPPGTYPTMFFLRGPYNPVSTTIGANTSSQFCRQCHAAESNEAYGGAAKTIL